MSKLKKWLSLALCLALLLTLLPQITLAARASASSGTCGENLTWTFDSSTGTLTIMGSGAMDSFDDYELSPWQEHLDSILTLSLPAGLTSISGKAFSYCYRLTSVTIPKSVTSIGESAFRWCTGLTSMNIPENVTSIGVRAFSNCPGLTGITVASGNSKYSSDSSGILFNKNKTKLVCCPEGFSGSYTIPGSVTSIEDYAFYDCSGLTSVSFPAGLTTIKQYAFYGCYGLTSVTLPESLKSIKNDAFCECTGLSSVTFPAGLAEIGEAAFVGCIALTSVTLPAGLTSIDPYAFAYCYNLKKITVAAGNQSYSSDSYGFLFDKNKTKLICCPGGFSGSYSLPDGVTTVGDRAFFGCEGLKSVAFPAGLTRIGFSAFYECTGLTSLSFPAGLTEIGYSAFCGCAGLKSVTFPVGLTKIDFSAFYDCTGLTSLSFPAGLTEIGSDAFCGCTGLTSAFIPQSVSSIGENAFEYCDLLTIYSYAGSYAQTYANEHDIPFVAVTAPKITTQPSNASAALGKTATFKVVAAGSGLSYQWQYKRAGATSWTNWSGKTQASLVVTAGSNNNGCRFRCVVKNIAGSVTSNAARLTITNAAPVIDTQPSNASAALGKTATFKVVAVGSGLSYQWQYKRAGATSWTNWSGKTEATLVVTAGSNNNGCRFRCVVKNSYGSVTSNAAQLTITNAAPVIDTQPSSASAALGKTATFKVVAAGSGLSYQWQYKRAGATSWTNWSGKTQASLVVTAGSNNNGCRFRCVVKNSYGSVTSNAAQLTITDAPPVIQTQPSNASAALGKTATFKVVAAGSGLSYQWQYKRAGATSWTNWSGKTQATLVVTAGSNNNGCRFRCVVKNAYGTVTSSAATLTVQ